ncbi:MAG TPA: putative baseplate assembly protein [Pyrinomonadaceae bacterium]|nr:putative baseplate assembly protein [Pyrinomonadaceae bacterium]
MSEVWWGKERSPRSRPRLVHRSGFAVKQPELLPADRKSVSDEVRSRIASFTPTWTSLRPTDAGLALVKLFSEQMEPVLVRLNRWPEKALVEFLDSAGVQTLPATPAEALLEFEVSDGATESVQIPAGFQVGAQPADDNSGLVIFETVHSLTSAPAKIVQARVQQSTLFQEVDIEKTSDTSPFLPFGKKPLPGRALWLGLASKVEPNERISLGIRVAAPPGAPPPAPSGGIAPLPVLPPPLLEWDVLDGASLEPAEVEVDETGGLMRSGIVTLRLPRRWREGIPEGMENAKPLHWLRLRIVHGRYAEAPKLSFVKLNVTRAIAARTIRDEVLEPVANARGRRWRLSQTPVLPESLILEVDDGGIESTAIAIDTGQPTEGQSESAFTAWKRVDDLLAYGADDKVYELNPVTGEVTFGDGLRGAAVPEGFRNVRARSYQAGGGKAGAVAAEEVSTLLSSVPFVTKVKNPLPASGGKDRESRLQSIHRGPQEIRARDRAVAIADYALLAERARGAQIERAHAVSGFHPTFPGLPIPGVVGVFVVPPDRNEGPPTPDEETLRAVARHLSEKAAPFGVEVVAAAPRYHRIRVETGLFINPEADSGETVRLVVTALNDYLHPLKGGEDGEGWPFGGTIRYPALLRVVTNVRGVRAVRRLNFVVDGIRIRSCVDYGISANALLWPESHQVTVLDPEDET